MSHYRYRTTVLAAVVGLILLGCFKLLQYDLLESVILLLDKVEHLGSHELVIPAFLVVVGLSIDLAVVAHRQGLQAVVQQERLDVMKTTVRTVQHVVNNYLNNVQLFRPDADGQEGEESVELFDTLNGQVAASLRDLGALAETPERHTSIGPMIDYEGSRVGEPPSNAGAEAFMG